MKIIIGENQEEEGEDYLYKEFESLDELFVYMKKRPSSVLYYFPEEKCLAIEDNYIGEMA